MFTKREAEINLEQIEWLQSRIPQATETYVEPPHVTTPHLEPPHLEPPHLEPQHVVFHQHEQTKKETIKQEPLQKQQEPIQQVKMLDLTAIKQEPMDVELPVMPQRVNLTQPAPMKIPHLVLPVSSSEQQSSVEKQHKLVTELKTTSLEVKQVKAEICTCWNCWNGFDCFRRPQTPINKRPWFLKRRWNL